VSGSTVGLGNFLRFPGRAAQNGGGAFLIPCFCALACLGIPIIGWAEWTMGRYGGKKGLNGVGVDAAAPVAVQTQQAKAFFDGFTGAGSDGSLFSGDGLRTVGIRVFVFDDHWWLADDARVARRRLERRLLVLREGPQDPAGGQGADRLRAVTA
jgi:hypothetical protein